MSGTKCSACQTESGNDGAPRRAIKIEKENKTKTSFLYGKSIRSLCSFTQSVKGGNAYVRLTAVHAESIVLQMKLCGAGCR